MITLDAYLARIGYEGPRTATLTTLRALHELHPAAIPFEAIDVLLERGVDISPEVVDAKLIGAGRGGYCFEQNSLFKRALEALGFEVEPLIARVRWMAPPEAPPGPRSHMALRVTIDGERWLADVGFGGRVLTAPIRFDVEAPQETGHERFRLVDGRLEVELETGWANVYELSGDPQVEMDFVAANWFTSTHPDSLFRNRLMVARTTPAARYGLMDNRLAVRRADGATTYEALDADGLERALIEVFKLPVRPDWRPVLARAAGDGV